MKKLHAALGGVLLLLLVGLVWYGAPVTSPVTRSPLFVVGQTYAVLWSCLNQIGCYGEVMVVREVRPDGWIRAQNAQEGAEWWLNSAAMLSVQSYQQHTAVPEPVPHPTHLLQAAHAH